MMNQNISGTIMICVMAFSDLELEKCVLNKMNKKKGDGKDTGSNKHCVMN